MIDFLALPSTDYLLIPKRGIRVGGGPASIAEIAMAAVNRAVGLHLGLKMVLFNLDAFDIRRSLTSNDQQYTDLEFAGLMAEQSRFEATR